MSSQTSTNNDVQINNNSVEVTNEVGNTFVLEPDEAEVVSDGTGFLGTGFRTDGLDRVFEEEDVETVEAGRLLHNGDRVRFTFGFSDGSELVVEQ
ncbi:hypothetical protein [Halorubrum distributum]|uniref:hypothetical protein n=1 Tax=Halorubrum distributum TaxID=29283 RepID=UPI00126920E3|nr:hypothetical protein [Halorubrum arcis]